MYTGSPHITNFSARQAVHAELQYDIYGACPVYINVEYDATSHNSMKLTATPSFMPANATSYLGAYRVKQGRWGIVEKKANAGDIVEVVLQGRVKFPNSLQESDKGKGITAFKPTQEVKENSPSNHTQHFCRPNCQHLNQGTSERDNMVNTLGVVVEIGDNGEFIIWQGVQTPQISDYSHGESHRVQAKLVGTYDGGDNASISAGVPVRLYLDENGDLKARGGLEIGPQNNSSVDFIANTNADNYYTQSGHWGICETGGNAGDVVDIVVAGHVQTNQTNVTENALLSHFEGNGDFFCLGKEIIKDYNDRQMGTDTGNWVGYNIADANVNVDDTISNAMQITTTDNEVDEGALLPVSEMETLVVGRKYIVSASIDHLGSGNITMRYELGGATSGDITATTSNRYHRVELTCTDASGPLRIYNVAESTARTIKIDNVFVYEKHGNTVDENVASTEYDWMPNTYGTTVNTTGKICIFPGVNRANIRDFKEQHIVTADLFGGTSHTDVTARQHAVALCVNKFGKLMAKRSEISSSRQDLYGQYTIADNMWGLALESGSPGDTIKVLVSGRVSDVNTSSDATWEVGDLLSQIDKNGKKERVTSQKYSFINSDDDKTITGSPNWTDYSPNTTIGGFNVNTSSGRVEITGSGNGNYKNTGGTGKEGAILARANFREMHIDNTTFNVGNYLPYRRTFLMKADVWSSGGTPPNIAFTVNESTASSTRSYIPRDADGSHVVTTTQKTFYAFVHSYTDASTGSYEDYMTISQTNNTTDTWYFTNVELLNMPYATAEHLAVCLNSNIKEWYIH